MSDVPSKVEAAFREVFTRTTFRADLTKEECEEWTSLKQVQLLSRLERSFGVELEPIHVSQLTSIPALVAFFGGRT